MYLEHALVLGRQGLGCALVFHQGPLVFHQDPLNQAFLVELKKLRAVRSFVPWLCSGHGLPPRR